MEKDGSSAVFLLGKAGVAIAAIALIGFAFSMKTTTDRLNEREELELIAGTITGALEKINGLPKGTEFYRELPPIADRFEVSVKGELIDGLQVISVKINSGSKLERLLILDSIVNNGDFFLSEQNPRGILIRKSDGINLELVG
ncbi:MAG: hypothetical protein H5T49_06270 [Hadesarchaea archaeon]|nr:hypothetical protein [Hadesarchaea archaeon]